MGQKVPPQASMEILNVSVSEQGLCLILTFPEAVEGRIRDEQFLLVLSGQKKEFL